MSLLSPRFGALLQNRNFCRLWIAQVGLALGDAVMQMGLLEFFRAHGYAVRVETAKLFLAVSLPGVVLAPVVIAYLDRWQRRQVLLLSDGLRALLVIVIAVWLLPVLTGRLEERGLLLVYAMVFLLGAITTFYYPARYAWLPNLVGAADMIPANTLFTTSLAVAQVGGRAVGGFVAEEFGVPWAVLANALAYLVAMLLVWGIRQPPHTVRRQANGVSPAGWSELKGGLLYLWRHPTAIPLVMLAMVFAFLLGVLIVAIVGYAIETLGLGTGGLGYLVAPAGVGAALGILALGRGGTWTRSRWLPFLQLILVGVVLVFLGLTRQVWLAVILLLALGAVAATIMIPIDAKLQEEVADDRRGGVFAARGMLTSVGMILAFSLQIWTPLLRRTPPPTLLVWLGGCSLLVAVLAALSLQARSRQVARHNG